MQIDWITVIAQVVNFLILLWLLKRFLFGRIVHIMDERERRIREQHEATWQERDAAQQERQKYQELMEQVGAERARAIDEAQAEVEQVREKWLTQARNEVEGKRQQWEAGLSGDRDAFVRELSRQTGEALVERMREIIAGLSGDDLYERLAGVFARHLLALPPDETARIASTGDNVSIRSPHALSGSSAQALTDSVRRIAGKTVEVRFETNPEMVFGIELVADGVKVPWTAQPYLDELRSRIEGAFDAAANVESAGRKAA